MKLAFLLGRTSVPRAFLFPDFCSDRLRALQYPLLSAFRNFLLVLPFHTQITSLSPLPGFLQPPSALKPVRLHWFQPAAPGCESFFLGWRGRRLVAQRGGLRPRRFVPDPMSPPSSRKAFGTTVAPARDLDPGVPPAWPVLWESRELVPVSG